MSCRNGWTEEEIVDFVMGKLSMEKAKAFERHVESCSTCSNEFSEWESLIADEQPMEVTVPSAKVKRRLFRKVRRSNGVPRMGMKVPAAVVASFCILAFFLFGTGMFKAMPGTVGSRHPAGNAVRSGFPSQIQYVPVSDKNVKGYVWVNGNTDEMMLYLNGLKHIQGKDYQAWLVSSKQHSNAGLIKVSHGMGQLYFHGPQLEHAQHIVVTVEPLGGSTVQTGPRKVSIQLNQ